MLVNTRTGKPVAIVSLPKRPTVVHHPARGCRRWLCTCGRLMTWSHGGNGQRIPDHLRDDTCPDCGTLHTR